MATLDTIAKIAGVNKTTVSKALRNSADINKETAARIKRIAAECGYKIKPKKNGFNIIGVICPEIKSDYYSQIIELLNDTFSKATTALSCCQTSIPKEGDYRHIEQRVLGLVCITESDGSNYIDRGFPQIFP